MDVERNSDSSVNMMVRSSNFNTIGQDQPNEHYISITRSYSSKYRGVISLRSGKWGARISFKYKPYWLGSFETDEEAAMAYDRAAIKLQRSDCPLNFPKSFYTVQETKFMSLYSNEQILNMIKDKNYTTRLTNYVRDRYSVQVSEAIDLAKQRGLVYHMLFKKELTLTDTTHMRGFHIPKESAVRFFPPLDHHDLNGDKSVKSVELTFYDRYACPWSFRYSYWRSTETFVFTKGWRHFVRMHNLMPKDIVVFYRGKYMKAPKARSFYMIDVHPHSAQVFPAHQNYEELAAGEDNNDELANNMEEDAAENDVKLFGAQIGKRRKDRQPFF